MCVFSPFSLPPLCCRFIPGPNREFLQQCYVPGSPPSSTLFLPTKWTRTITSTGTDWITWDHRKDLHLEKTDLLIWCQGFETRLIPCLINELHIGDSSLPDCGHFLYLSLSTYPSPTLFSLCLNPQKWNSSAGVVRRLLKHYLKTFAQAACLPEAKWFVEPTWTWTWEP